MFLGMHMLHLGIVKESRSGESILTEANNGPPGVSGVTGNSIDVPLSDSAILLLLLLR